MKPLSEKDIIDLLSESDRSEPSAELAAQLKAEIPATWAYPAPPCDNLPTRNHPPGRPSWLLAAGLAAAILGGSFLTFKLRQAEEAASQRTEPVASSSSADRDLRASTVGSPEPKQDVGQRADAAQNRTEAAQRQPVPPAHRLLIPQSSQALADKKEKEARSREMDLVSPQELTVIDEALNVGEEVPLGETSAAAGGVLSSVAESAPKPAPAPAAEAPASPQRIVAPEPGISYALAPDQEQFRRAQKEAKGLEAELKKLRTEPAREGEPKKSIPQAQVAPPSTGGTAEPNDAPYGDVFFRSYGTNPMIDTEDDRLSTFGLDVDTGSYTVVRRFLTDGHLPPPAAVRVEEFINYFHYGDQPPQQSEFAIHAEGAPSRFGEGERYYLLRFNLRGRELQTPARRPAQLTFVVDVSGSMAQENRLHLVQRALGLLLDALRPEDRVALVVYGSIGRVLLPPTADKGAIRQAIAALVPEGATNAEEGLRLAYDLAMRQRLPGAINRVILCSDGVANVGATGPESILARIRHAANQGIELTTVGFGMGNYNDVLMEQLADQGNGRYAYVDTLEEAQRLFVEDLTGTLQTLAAEARVQVEFNPQTVLRYRLLGYENRDVADHRFRDDTVDAGEIGVGHSVTALYELKLQAKPRPEDWIATLRLRYGAVDRGEMVELEQQVKGADFAASWDSASTALRLTSLVAEFAEILQATYWAKAGDLETVFRLAQRLSADFAGDRDVADFVSLVGRAAALSKEPRR